jgi:hypothetical protein
VTLSKSKSLVFFIFILTLLLTLILLPAAAWAESDTDTSLKLTVSPPTTYLSANPRDAVSTQIRIKNEGINSEHIQINLEKFTTADDLGNIKFETPTAQDTFIQWIKFSQNVFDISPGEWKTISATINMPKDAAFGYYYAVEFVVAKPGAQDVVTSGHFTGAIASLILLNAATPNVHRELQLESFKTSSPLYEFGPAQFQIKIKNIGNVHTSPRGDIFVDRGDGSTIGILDINPNKSFILPNTERVFNVDWTDVFPVNVSKIQDGKIALGSDGQPEKSLTWDFNKLTKLGLGHYDARLLLVYDNGKRDVPIERATDFWIIPWRIALAGLVVALLALFGLLQTVRPIIRLLKRRLSGK